MTRRWEEEPHPDDRAARRVDGVWAALGFGLFLVVLGLGLAWLAAVLVTVTSMNTFGSNK